MTHETDKPKMQAAVEMGRRGGMARAQKLSREEQTAHGRKAALARWAKRKSAEEGEKKDGEPTPNA